MSPSVPRPMAALLALLATAPAAAQATAPSAPSELPTVAPVAADAEPTASEGPVALAGKGRPKVVLDRLIFPEGIVGARTFKKHLRRALRREARRADWGAGREARIEYRFHVTELFIERDGDVLRVRCEAVGTLPRGKQAKSQLSFGGSPRERTKTVQRVLEIVARGVITRLAELERIRRGDLEPR